MTLKIDYLPSLNIDGADLSTPQHISSAAHRTSISTVSKRQHEAVRLENAIHEVFRCSKNKYPTETLLHVLVSATRNEVALGSLSQILSSLTAEGLVLAALPDK